MKPSVFGSRIDQISDSFCGSAVIGTAPDSLREFGFQEKVVASKVAEKWPSPIDDQRQILYLSP